jgi:hypothetical protein
MIKLKIDVSKIDKARLFKGAKGTYLDLVVYENDQPDDYGNTFSVKQDCSKEDREAGVKMPYIGSGKTFGQPKPQAPPQRTTNKIPRAAPAAQQDDSDEQIPW